MPETVVLTGATGFIGGNLLKTLVRQGYAVRALARRPRSPVTGVHWIRGDIRDPASLKTLLNGCSTVIHCAGTVRGASAEYFARVNRDGTRNLAQVAAQLPQPPRFLLISSAAAREPALSWYGRSKREAEECLQATGLRSTTFRPTAVYGPGDREILPLLKAMRIGFLPLAGAPHARFSLLHVQDLAAAVDRWLGIADAPPGTFELHDGTAGGYDWPAVTALAEEAWGRRITVIRIPLPLLSGMAVLNTAFSRLVGRLPMLTPGKIRELTHPDWVCDNGAVNRAINWNPTITLRDAMQHDHLLGF